MQDDERLTREIISKAFTLMGEILARERVIGEIHIYGGTAIMLQMSARENTQDVDCVITSGHGAVVKAMMAVKQKLKLPSGWLNEAVSIYASRNEAEHDFLPFGQYPSFNRPFLRVMTARPEYILAMKIEALERGEQRDFNDTLMIGERLGLKTVDDLVEIRNRYFSKPIPPDVTRVLHGIAARLAEKDNSNDHQPSP